VKVPREITILIDSREQRPLLFPSTVEWHRVRGRKPHTIFVKTKRVALPAGDYVLEGYDEAIIERKGSLRELASNLLSDDHRRAKAAFLKLVEATDHPYLLLDCDLGELMTPSANVPDAKIVLDCLLDLTQGMGIRLLIVGGCKAAPARRRLGEFVIRLLLAHCLRSPIGPVDVETMEYIVLHDKLQGLEVTDVGN